MKFVLTDSDCNVWTCSECGEKWTFLEGGPKENNVNFCMKCGVRIEHNDKENDRFICNANHALWKILNHYNLEPCEHCVCCDLEIEDEPCASCQRGSFFYYDEEEINL